MHCVYTYFYVFLPAQDILMRKGPDGKKMDETADLARHQNPSGIESEM